MCFTASMERSDLKTSLIGMFLFLIMKVADVCRDLFVILSDLSFSFLQFKHRIQADDLFRFDVWDVCLQNAAGIYRLYLIADRNVLNQEIIESFRIRRNLQNGRHHILEIVDIDQQEILVTDFSFDAHDDGVF